MTDAAISFDRVAHLIRVPVDLGGDRYLFLVDTGIGITVIAPVVATRSDVQAIDETVSAQRMSGQTIESPLVRLPPITLGDFTVNEHLACVAELGPSDGPNGFAGILGLDFFEPHAITSDPRTQTLTVHAVEEAPQDGFSTPLDIRRDDRTVSAFATLVLPSGREISVEVDTGSDSLILDTRFMTDCGIDPDDPAVTTTTGTDETGYQWTRHRATVNGSVHLAGASDTAQASPRVIFQEIIHDGLVGTAYLDRYRTTYDITGSRLYFAPLAE